MSSLNIRCPKCNAASAKEGFGTEPTRVLGTIIWPVHAVSQQRREKANAIKKQNRMHKIK